ncbi:unnamed protein product, partial [Staurois parvus]
MERTADGMMEAVCIVKECGGYDSEPYVQERSVEGMTVGSMYRRGVWR